MVDDQPDHARVDHQLPDPQHAGRGRSDGAPGTAYQRAGVFVDRGAFQGAIMAQPICGYVLDVLGLKIGFAIFAIAWSLVNMAHALANSWQAFAGCAGCSGFAKDRPTRRA